MAASDHLPDHLHQMLVDTAYSQLGVREVGVNDGEAVARYQKAVDGRDDNEPWCMGLVQWCVAQVEARTGARATLYRSERCAAVWMNTPFRYRRQKPEKGSIAIWIREHSSSGHCGVVVSSQTPTVFETIEGNTSDGQGINRDGDGVYHRVRRLDAAGPLRLVGFLMPFG